MLVFQVWKKHLQRIISLEDSGKKNNLEKLLEREEADSAERWGWKLKWVPDHEELFKPG